ncbi:MAG: hypothetical protein WAX69_27315 [Victivallales bacterium]
MKIVSLIIVLSLFVATSAFSQINIDSSGISFGKDKKDKPAKNKNDEVQPVQNENNVAGKNVKPNSNPPKLDTKGNAYKTISLGDDITTIKAKCKKLGINLIEVTSYKSSASNYYDTFPEDVKAKVFSYLRSKKDAPASIHDSLYAAEVSGTAGINFIVLPYNIGLNGVIINFPMDIDVGEVMNKINSEGGMTEESSVEKLPVVLKSPLDSIHMPYVLTIPFKKYSKTENDIITAYILYDYEKADIKKCTAEEKDINDAIIADAKAHDADIDKWKTDIENTYLGLSTASAEVLASLKSKKQPKQGFILGVVIPNSSVIKCYDPEKFKYKEMVKTKFDEFLNEANKVGKDKAKEETKKALDF